MGSPLCVLIVDDSAFFLELEKQFLRNTPATIMLANNARDALRLAKEKRPSLVFMDIDMPEEDGLAACRKFKNDAELCDIPVVLIGDRANPEHEPAAKLTNCDAYLQKPLDRRHFLETGHRFLISIDRREARSGCELPVAFTCRGRRNQGECLDLSSGGMFLKCLPTAQKGERLLLKFNLPDESKTQVDVNGRVAWMNNQDQIIKADYPFGYGVEFVDISEVVGVALRRHFGT